MNTKAEPIFVSEERIKRELTWKMVNEAVEQAILSASNPDQLDATKPFSNQPARSFTFTGNKAGVMLTMPGFVGHYKLGNEKFNTLACKLLTSFTNNVKLERPLPNILANILLFDSSTGQLQCVMEATEITAWRTASASIIATKHLFYGRKSIESTAGSVLSIIGSGVQGRIHALGMCNSFNISEVRLWNRSPEKATKLLKELESLKNSFVNKNVKVILSLTIRDCVAEADIIVTATFSGEPFLHSNMLKENVHINAVGAGVNRHSEVSEELYQNSELYIDNWANAKTELETLNATILGEVGEVINGTKSYPVKGRTIFQSMGMASEDATVAQALYDVIQKQN